MPRHPGKLKPNRQIFNVVSRRGKSDSFGGLLLMGSCCSSGWARWTEVDGNWPREENVLHEDISFIHCTAVWSTGCAFFFYCSTLLYSKGDDLNSSKEDAWWFVLMLQTSIRTDVFVISENSFDSLRMSSCQQMTSICCKTPDVDLLREEE